MGLFRATTQAEELDPRWQRRRRRLSAALGLIALAGAGVAVWHFAAKQPQPAPVPDTPDASAAAVPATPAPDQEPDSAGPVDDTDQQDESAGVESAAEPGLAGVVTGVVTTTAQDHRRNLIDGTQLSLELANPRLFQWVREWDQIGAPQADLEDEIRTLEVFLLTGDRVRAEHWVRRLQSRLADSDEDRQKMADDFGEHWKLLQWSVARRLDRAIERLDQLATDRPATAEEQLLKVIALRELAATAEPTAPGLEATADSPPWGVILVDIATGNDRVAALARAELLRLLEAGLAEQLPREALARTGVAAAEGSASATPDDDSVQATSRQLALWLRQRFEQDAAPGTAEQWTVHALDWALADQESGQEVMDAIVEAAADLEPIDRLFVAEWLWRRDAWEQVVQLLQPGAEVPLTPLTLDLYTSAMKQLDLEEDLAAELSAGDSRWPEGLALLWQVRQAATEGGPEVSGVLQGLLMRTGRQIRELEPGWVFDVARTAYATDFTTTGRELLLLATEAPVTRERALTMLLDQAFQSGQSADVRYILNQLRQLTGNPGPWHGLWLWFELMRGGAGTTEAGTILSAANQWLDGPGAGAPNPSEARFVGAMAAFQSGDHQIARAWLPQVAPNDLPSRYLPFYLRLKTRLGQDTLVTRPLERRPGARAVLLTPEEIAWLGPGDDPPGPDAQRARLP